MRNCDNETTKTLPSMKIKPIEENLYNLTILSDGTNVNGQTVYNFFGSFLHSKNQDRLSIYFTFLLTYNCNFRYFYFHFVKFTSWWNYKRKQKHWTGEFLFTLFVEVSLKPFELLFQDKGCSSSVKNHMQQWMMNNRSPDHTCKFLVFRYFRKCSSFSCMICFDSIHVCRSYVLL